MPVHKPNLGLLPWVTVQCGLPHRQQLKADGTEATHYKRTNGTATLVMLADPEVGLPYGKLPRLILAWLVGQYRLNLTHMSPEEARIIELGPSCRALMQRLGLDNTGRGYAQFKEQLWRLLTCDIQSRGASTVGPHNAYWFRRHPIAVDAHLWWLPEGASAENVHGLRRCYVELSPKFAQACEGAVPVDLDTMAAMRSPFALDLYAWLSYRCAKLEELGTHEAEVSWTRLQEQFGHNYRRLRDFKRAFRQHLRTVLDHYPARVDHQSWEHGILLYPRPPHIERRRG